MKRVQANERDKRGCGCIECAGGVSVSEATSKTTFPPLWPLCYRRRPDTGEGNQLRYRNCWKPEVEDLEESFPLDRVFLLSSPRPYLRVERGAGWGWRYNPEQRSLEARNERAETSSAFTFETGPNASLRPTIVHRLLPVLDKAFRPKREKEEEGRFNNKKRNTHEEETHKSAATMFPQNRPPVSRLHATIQPSNAFNEVIVLYPGPPLNATCL